MVTECINIFDKSNINDLPPELVKELNLLTRPSARLLKLFSEAGGTLDLSALLVGYYRKYGETKTRPYMTITCHRLRKKGLISPTPIKGEYQITERGRTFIGKETNDADKT